MPFFVFGFLPLLWVGFGGFRSFSLFLVRVVGGLVRRSIGKGIGGSFTIFSSLFLLLIFLNVFGLVPYAFSLRSHLSVNLSISFPL